MNRISLSIIKNNKLFSASLLSIYGMVTVILVMLIFFYPSVQKSLDTFLEDYGLADATVVTQLSATETETVLEQIEGIRTVDAVLALEGKTTLANGDVVTLRYSTIPEGSECRYYNTVTQTDVSLNDESVLVSSRFAEKNGVGEGDPLNVKINGKTVTLKVTDVVSCPDTIYVARDVNSWFDDTQYGFVYVSGELMDSVFHTGNVSNIFELWFEDDADGEAVLASAEETLKNYGISVESATLAEDSTVYYQIHSTLDGTKAVVTYLPVLIFLMGILFCGFFVYQVICSSRNMIGILQALGMGTAQICGIFIRYSSVLCTAALILGFALGVPVLNVFLNIYKNIFLIPQIVWSGDLKALLYVVLAVYAIGVLSCVVCVGAISGNDPSVLFSNGGNVCPPEDEKMLRRLRLGAYIKITVASVLRNKKRMFVMILCNTACFLLTFLSLSVLASKVSGMDFMFNQRFGYDYIVIAQDEETMEYVSELPGVDTSEYAASAVFDYEDEYMRIEALGRDSALTDVVSTDGEVLSVPEEGIILEEGFARRHGLSEGDTVCVGGVSLSVTAISREYFYSTQYVSFETAKRLEITTPNALYVRLEDPETDSAEFKKQLGEIDGVDCFYAVSERKISAVSSMQAIDAPCYLFTVLGILIGLAIVSNANIHSIQQRKKEFATLKVLGTSDIEFNKMFLFEILMQYLLSLLPGLLISIPLSRWILQKMSSMSMEFVSVHIPCVAIASAAAVLLYLILSLISARKTVDKLNLPEILAKQ